MGSLLCVFSNEKCNDIEQFLFQKFDHVECRTLHRGVGYFCKLLYIEDNDTILLYKKSLSSLSSCNIEMLYFEDIDQLSDIQFIAFDMDSTLIKTEVIDELAKYAQVEQKISEITARAMEGEIDFESSFEQRIELLSGIKSDVLDQIASELPLMPGAIKLFQQLKQLNINTAIISGGFLYFAEYLKHKLGVDDVYANQLEIKEGLLTGNYLGDILGPDQKSQILMSCIKRYGYSVDQSMAVGDGANDIPMLHTSGLGIGFHAKPIVKKQLTHTINNASLDAISHSISVARGYSLDNNLEI
jgi:phosphoserine phosphatase